MENDFKRDQNGGRDTDPQTYDKEEEKQHDETSCFCVWIVRKIMTNVNAKTNWMTVGSERKELEFVGKELLVKPKIMNDRKYAIIRKDDDEYLPLCLCLLFLFQILWCEL